MTVSRAAREELGIHDKAQTGITGAKEVQVWEQTPQGEGASGCLPGRSCM